MSEVFISYSHQDKGFLDKLRRHFRPFENRINFWDDSKILPGQKWKNEIEGALIKCKIAILMISADFFSSEFINEVELPRLLEQAENNGTLILSIILKPCLFDEYPGINQYQAMNSPQQPVSELNDSEQEKLFVSVAKRIKEHLL